MFLVKFTRINRGLSQTAIAKQIGVSHSIISNIESGRMNPTDRERKLLSKLLGIPEADLLKQVDAQREAK